MKFFWVLWGFDAVIALIFLYFFFVGLADGSVSSFNGGLWFLILAGLGAILLGSYWLRQQQTELGNGLTVRTGHTWIIGWPVFFTRADY